MKTFGESFTQYPKDLYFCRSGIINIDSALPFLIFMHTLKPAMATEMHS